MIKGLIAGLQFLTRLPINIPVDFDEENIGRATFFFPFIGMLLGFFAYIPYYLIGDYSKSIGSFLSVVTMILLTGGLHLDGVSDMVDGFFSSRDKDKMMEIMADSRIGAFGVLSLILFILFEYIIISEFNDSKHVMYALIFSMGNARLTVLSTIQHRKMVKPGGMGDMIHSSNNKKYAMFGRIAYLLVIFIVNSRFLAALTFSLFAELLISHLSYKKIGGVTGDIYGAVIELTQLASLIGFLGAVQWI